jgi:hypothetical protein
MTSLSFKEVMSQMDKAISEMAHAVEELRGVSFELNRLRDDIEEDRREERRGNE